MKLIESANEAKSNAKAFNKIDRNSDARARKHFAKFFHGYYSPDLKIFAPSKFIGYKNTTIKDYEGAGTGTETQGRLSRWFEKVEAGDEQFASLKEQLEKYAQRVGKRNA